MKVAFKKKTSEQRERLRGRLQIGINQVRNACGWDWADTNAHCLAEFGTIVQDMDAPALYRFYKDLCNLRKFQVWKETHGRD